MSGVNINELKKVLAENRIRHTLIELPPNTPNTVDAHLDAVQGTYDQSCATLVFQVGDEVMALLRRGDTKIDNKALRRAASTNKLRFLKPEELIDATGMAPGRVSPFLIPDMPIMIDSQVLKMKQMYVGTGGDEYMLLVEIEDLLKYIKSKFRNLQIVDVTTPDQDKQSRQRRILSGVNPTSSKGLHLGNYLGAVKQHVEFQEQGECYYFIADYHALNTVFDPSELRSNIRNTFLEYLALGIDTDKTVFFVESHVREIFELTEILNNMTTVSQMMRMHAYKDKMQDENTGHESINVGLFTYPILMAADILIFEPDIVPVGEDQKQHVEVARDIAQAFNNRYGDLLKVPDVFIKKSVGRLPGTDGERKMSKSLGNTINIFAPEETIKKQIMGIVTDPNRIHKDDPGDPEKNVTFKYMRELGFDQAKQAEFEERYRAGKIGDVEIKKAFFEHYLDYFGLMRERRARLEKDGDIIEKLMLKGSETANAIAHQTMDKVREGIGAFVI